MEINSKKLKEELHRLESIDDKGEAITRTKINKVLLYVTSLISITITFFVIIRGEGMEYAAIQIIGQLIASIFFIGAIKNKFWGYSLISFMSVATACIYTYLNPNHYSDLITLYYGIAILVCANQFLKIGFLVSSILMTTLTIVIYAHFPSIRYPHEVISTVFNSLVLGCIPLLLQIMARSINIARKEELRAEILAIENQELIQSLGSFFKSHTEKDKVIEKSTGEYTSPYGVTS